MFRTLISIVFNVSSVIAPCVVTANPPLETASDSFDSYEKAAHAALRVAMAIPESTTHEFCGAVLAIEGRFYFTQPMSSGSETECTTRVPLPEGVSLAAIYHTHPQVTPILKTSVLCNARHNFSRLDLATAKALKVPSFIGLPWSREIVVFKPPIRRPVTTQYAATIRK